MTLESEHRLVSKVFRLPVEEAIFGAIAVVKTRVLLWHRHVSEFVVADGLADIPDF